MNKTLTFLTAFLLAMPFIGWAQEPERVSPRVSLAETKKDTVKYWNFSGLTSVNFNQVQFSNWAAGGENNISIAALGNYGAYYAKDHWKWDSFLDFGFGLIKPEDQSVRKNDDRWSVVSKVAYRLTPTPKWYASARAELRSQFTEGFAPPPGDTVRISHGFAPAYSMVSLGLEYTPVPELAIGIYPITNKITYVFDDRLSAIGAFGVKPGEKTRVEALGAMLSALYKKQFGKTLAVQSRLELFNNYTDEDTKNRVNIDVNWETTLNIKATKYLGVSLFVHVLYDQNTPIAIYKKIDGEKVKVGSGPRTQIKQVLGVAFSYQFDTRKKK